MKKVYLREAGVICFFALVASLGLLYAQVLPPVVSADEYAVLLGVRAAQDPTLPDHDLLINYHYDFYLYPKLLSELIERYDPQVVRDWLLFVYIFSVGYAAYWSLRFLKIRPLVAAAVSLIALMPRLSLGATFFGVFTPLENMGRTLALPIIWLLASWQINCLYRGKGWWPVLLVAGLASYLHPVSMIFFSGLLLLLGLLLAQKRSGWSAALKGSLAALVAYVVGASVLLWEVFARTSVIAGVARVAGATYADALKFRLAWEFVPDNLLWLRSMFVISLFFVIFAAIVYRRLLRRGAEESLALFAYRWAATLIILASSLALVLPNVQLALVRYLDWPLVLQQTSRIFNFVYLGLFVMFGVGLGYLYRRLVISRAVLIVLVLTGLVSSSLGFEWAQFVFGYANYERYYIPQSWQAEKFHDDQVVYPEICAALRSSQSSGRPVISRDFKLRYFCRVAMYATFEEGGAYLNAGKAALVEWQKKFERQQKVLNSGSLTILHDFATGVGAQQVVVDGQSSLTLLAERAGWPVVAVADRAIITIK